MALPNGTYRHDLHVRYAPIRRSGRESVQSAKSAVRVGTEDFGNNAVQFFLKSIELQLFQIQYILYSLTGCSKMRADVPRVQHSLFCEFVWDCTERVLLVGSTGRENDDHTGDNGVVLAYFYFLCWSLKEHREQS